MLKRGGYIVSLEKVDESFFIILVESVLFIVF